MDLLKLLLTAVSGGPSGSETPMRKVSAFQSLNSTIYHVFPL